MLDKQAESGQVIVGPRSALSTARVQLRAVRLHRDGARVRSVKLRYRSRALPAAWPRPARAGRHRRLAVRSG